MVGKADIYGAGTPDPEINKWSCLPPQNFKDCRQNCTQWKAMHGLPTWSHEYAANGYVLRCLLLVPLWV